MSARHVGARAMKEANLRYGNQLDGGQEGRAKDQMSRVDLGLNPVLQRYRVGIGQMRRQDSHAPLPAHDLPEQVCHVTAVTQSAYPTHSLPRG